MKKNTVFFKNKKAVYITALILITILLVIFSFVFGNKKTAKTANKIMSYPEYLEAKLSPILSDIKDAGKVSVMITVSSETEYEIAFTTVTNSKGEKTETPYLINGEPVKTNEKYPEITGVLIVCEGALNYGVYHRVLEATKAILNVPESKIEILPGK
ncbi:MAG: hypothetical protein HP008_06435 [Clostridia bacterium]|nr:hypothetical protein [Clostridia bacterium]